MKGKRRGGGGGEGEGGNTAHFNVLISCSSVGRG